MVIEHEVRGGGETSYTRVCGACVEITVFLEETPRALPSRGLFFYQVHHTSFGLPGDNVLLKNKRLPTGVGREEDMTVYREEDTIDFDVHHHNKIVVSCVQFISK